MAIFRFYITLKTTRYTNLFIFFSIINSKILKLQHCSHLNALLGYIDDFLEYSCSGTAPLEYIIAVFSVSVPSLAWDAVASYTIQYCYNFNFVRLPLQLHWFSSRKCMSGSDSSLQNQLQKILIIH